LPFAQKFAGHLDLNQNQNIVDPLAYSNVLLDAFVKLLICDNSRVSTSLTCVSKSALSLTYSCP